MMVSFRMSRAGPLPIGSLSVPGKVVMDQANGHGPLTDRGRDPFDRAAADVTHSEDAGAAGLEHPRLRCVGAHLRSGQDVTALVQGDTGRQPAGARLRPDEGGHTGRRALLALSR